MTTHPISDPILIPRPARGRAKIFDKIRTFQRARDLQESGLYPYFKPITDSEGTVLVIEGQQKLNMGSNNYLGLTHHPKVLEAGKRAVDRYGAGCTGSRFLNGTLDLHEELEARLAELFGKEDALVYSTGYQANLGMISGLVGRNDVALLDKCDHASIVDGARLAYGSTVRFEHSDLGQLEVLLERHRDQGLLIIVDGVYSMEGDIAPLPALAALAHRYGAALAVDDAHSLGVLGPRGDGTSAHFDCTEQVDMIVGTFSKSLASIGGFVAADEPTIHFLKHNSRPLMFSAALPPFSVASVIAALEVMLEEGERRDSLWANTHHFQKGLADLGFNLLETETPIIPVVIGPDETTFLFWRRLFEEGVFTNPVVAPAVPPGEGRLRASLIATHTADQIDDALEVFGRVGRELGLI